MLEVGNEAPDFALPDQVGKTHRLSDYKGRRVVLYFYPKDDTSGCTKEACSFRDSFSKFKKAGIEVLGVSADNQESHAKFQQKYNLPFILLSDTEKKVVKDYGVWVEKINYGKKYWGIARMTFLINEDGEIIHVYEKVKPEEHAEEVLERFSK